MHLHRLWPPALLPARPAAAVAAGPLAADLDPGHPRSESS